MAEILTVAELKNWVGMNFQRFAGPPRAYFEIGEERRIYITLLAYGVEMDTVRAMHNILKGFVIDNDSMTPIFIRRDFEYETLPEGKLTARLCFWDPAMNEKLGGALLAKKEGQP